MPQISPEVPLIFMFVSSWYLTSNNLGTKNNDAYLFQKICRFSLIQ